MLDDRCKIQWIGHLRYNISKKSNSTTHNKIWGWYFLNGNPYAFWAYNSQGSAKIAELTFKNLMVKKHSDCGADYDINFVAQKKMKKGYNGISLDELLVIWPSFCEDLTRFLN